MDGGCKSLSGFVRPSWPGPRRTRGSAKAVVRPVGGATACLGDNGETNFAERNIARWQSVTPAPAAWGFCHGSRFAQKYCLRFAFDLPEPRTKTHATRPGGAFARGWTAASPLPRQGR